MDDFEKELAGQAEQGSGMWHDIRAGRFTSSEMHRLMKSGSRLMTPEELKARPKSGVGSSAKWIDDDSCLSDDTETYIREKIAEVLTGQSKGEVFAHATAWGEEQEPYALEMFGAKMNRTIKPIQFVTYGDHSGGSPDQMLEGNGNEILDEPIEVKSPYNSANQVKYLELTDMYDLKREHPDHYWQIQSNILFTQSLRGHFVGYDPRMKDDRHKMAHIIVDAVKEDHDLIKKKLETAVKKLEKGIETLNKLVNINHKFDGK